MEATMTTDQEAAYREGFDHGYFDGMAGDRHRAVENEDGFNAESPAYREGYEDGWTASQSW
jgi:hypothetical protein